MMKGRYYLNAKAIIVLSIVIAFVSGWYISSLAHDYYLDISKITFSGLKNSDYKTLDNKNQEASYSFFSGIMPTGREVSSPYDRVKEEQIQVYSNEIKLKLNNTQWSTFTDTNSMDPIIDEGANGIEAVPKTPDEIHVGDIVSYEYKGSYIIHRVVKIAYDEQGIYFIMKGDNNPTRDPEKVRFSQIKGILIAVIY